KAMKRLAFLIWFSFASTLQLFNPSTLHAAPAPSAQEILESVRMLETRQQLDLDGQLRQNDTVVPFHLSQNGPVIRYSFTDPEEVVELRLSENNSRLDLVTDDGPEKFPAEKLDEKI